MNNEDEIELTTMTVQLIDSAPNGVKVRRVEGESLTTVVVPRELLPRAKSLPEIPKRGVYYLLDEDHGVIKRAYAGQTTMGLARLDSHKSQKDFWNIAVMFLDDEVNIDLDVLNALEAKAIDYIRTHGSYDTDNTVTPQPYFSQYKKKPVRRLHERILFIMAALGYDLGGGEDVSTGDTALFHTRRNGIAASGRFNQLSNSFTVLAGSQVDLSHPPIKSNNVSEKRRQLFGGATGVVTLGHDVSFSSPSAAAVFVLGGSQNGWTEWINGVGQTLDSVYPRERN